MSLEANIARIADALEIIAGKAGNLPATKAAPTETKVTKIATVKVSAKPAPAAVAEPTVAAVSKEDVGNDIVGLIQANQRDAAVKLLAKFGSKAVSEVKETDYAALHTEAQAILSTI